MGEVVAVLGGGQLGRMLGLAGVPLGLSFRFLDPSPEAPAQALGPLVVGALGDEAALRDVARGATAVTYEWEGVPAEGARALEQLGYAVRPGPNALEVAQDRLGEKETFRRLGIPVPAFAAVDTRDELARALDDIGTPAVLKTRRGGYDGKGQVVLHRASAVEAAWAELGAPAVLEQMVRFDRELSVLAVRSLAGETRCYPLVENRHAAERGTGGILRASRAPAPAVTPALQAAGEAIAGRLLDDLGYVGVLAIELFQVGDELLANEFAPRVHNSGHWTIEGAETSQFENHLRAMLGRPLGSTNARGHSVMLNCIGAMPDIDRVLAVPGAHLHDYGKTPREGRKLGHVTVTAATAEELDDRVARLEFLVDA